MPSKPPESSTILIVEDNEVNRDILTRRLGKRGYPTLIAHDGVEALQQLKKHDIDLVIMDMQLPIQDGWTTCQIIKEDPEFGHVPIIALTAHALTNDRERALLVGCSDYATKPMDFKKLLVKIQRQLTIGVEQ